MSDRILVASRKGLFTIRRTPSGDWSISEPAFLGTAVSMTLADPRDGALYAALETGHFGAHLHRSRDGGANWEEVAVPTFPEGAVIPERMLEEPDPNAPPSAPPTKPAALSEIWELVPGGPEQPGVLWCGTIPGALFKSNDSGDSWELVESLWERPERMQWFGGGKDDSGVHSIMVDPRDPDNLVLGISCGGVWRVTGSGAECENIGQGLRAEFMPPDQQYNKIVQDPHRLVVCPSAPDHVWVQHHNGVFYSTDGGDNFAEIEDVPPAVFGFAVAVHPHDGQTAWFVPAKKDEFRVPVDASVVVSKTTDGGESFTVCREGLPQQHAYDIVFRHALDVDSTGERLVMGSSTGGLWVSEDAGDTWRQVAGNLPPIYAVRFAPEG